MADTSQEVHEVEGSVVESADECSEANVDGRPVSGETLRFFSHSQLGHFRQCVLCVGSDLGEEEVQLGVSRPEEGQEVAMVAFQGVRSAIGLGLVLLVRCGRPVNGAPEGCRPLPRSSPLSKETTTEAKILLSSFFGIRDSAFGGQE